MRENKSDFTSQLNASLDMIGLSLENAVSELSVTGADPLLNSTLKLGTAIGVPLLSAAAGAAQIWHEATGRSQRLSLDLPQALHSLTPYLGAGNRLNGYGSNMGSLRGLDGGLAPAVFDFYQTADDRWVIPIACYPRPSDELLSLLGTAHTQEHIRTAIASWKSWDLEEAAAERGIPLAVVRSREEFLAHPQGQAIQTEPLVSIEKIGDAPIKPLPAGDQPLSALRCLQFTHIFAGTAMGRTLAEYGADVLHVCEPDAFDHDLCWNETAVGIRSTRLELREDSGGRRTFDQLLRETDVFVHNHRASKLARLGLTPEECAEISEGLIYCSIRCYGHSGPWSERGGFDHQAQALVGINWNEGEDERPHMPPGRMLNDYLAAYFAAAGVMAATLKQAREGGSYLVRVSLAGCANWAWELGTLDKSEVAAQIGTAAAPPEPEWLVHQTPLGEFQHIAPPVRLSETPADWRHGPVLVPRGSSAPVWRTDRAAAAHSIS